MKLSDMADLALWAYKEPGESEEQHCLRLADCLASKDLVGVCFGDGTTEGYVAFDKKTPCSAYVVFRGTEMEWGDLLADLKVWPEDLPDCIGKVHGGAWRALDSVWPEVVQIISEASPICIEFEGHSLGGMLARLAAYRSYEDLPEQIVCGVTTFGAPAVGNGAFAASLNFALRGWIVNVCNVEDAVTRLWTPWLMGYRMAGKTYLIAFGGVSVNPNWFHRVFSNLWVFLKDVGKFFTTGQFRPRAFEAHYMKNYVKRLKEIEAES